MKRLEPRGGETRPEPAGATARPARARASLTPLCGALVLLVLVGCGSGDPEPGAGEEPAPELEAVSTKRLPSGIWPGKGHRTVTVLPGQKVPIFRKPGGRRVTRVGDTTEFGSTRVLSVLERRGRWISVATPATGDNSPGWLRIDIQRLGFGRVPYFLLVDLGEQRVELRHRGAPTQSFPVTIGAAGTSTPPGRFAVTDVITRGLLPVYGCCAIALSARQSDLPANWIGGDRVAIHGTTGPVGGASSSGCVRCSNADIRKLIEDLPLGTPVRIKR